MTKASLPQKAKASSTAGPGTKVTKAPLPQKAKPSSTAGPGKKMLKALLPPKPKAPVIGDSGDDDDEEDFDSLHARLCARVKDLVFVQKMSNRAKKDIKRLTQECNEWKKLSAEAEEVSNRTIADKNASLAEKDKDIESLRSKVAADQKLHDDAVKKHRREVQQKDSKIEDLNRLRDEAVKAHRQEMQQKDSDCTIAVQRKDKELQDKTTELEDCHASMQKLEEKIKEVNDQLDAKREEVEELRANLEKKHGEVETLQTDKEVANQKTDDVERQKNKEIERLTAEKDQSIESLQVDIEEMNDHKERLDADINEGNLRIDALQAEKNKLEDDLRQQIVTLEATVEKCRQDIKDIMTGRDAGASRVVQLEEISKSLYQSYGKMIDQIRTLRTQNSELLREFNEAQIFKRALQKFAAVPINRGNEDANPELHQNHPHLLDGLDLAPHNNSLILVGGGNGILPLLGSQEEQNEQREQYHQPILPPVPQHQMLPTQPFIEQMGLHVIHYVPETNGHDNAQSSNDLVTSRRCIPCFPSPSSVRITSAASSVTTIETSPEANENHGDRQGRKRSAGTDYEERGNEKRARHSSY